MVAFYLDNDVSVRLGQMLHADGHIVTHTKHRGLQRAHDEAQLATAVELDATLITHNYKDFLLLHRAWELWRSRWSIAEMHPGILVLPQGIDAVLKSHIDHLLERGRPGHSIIYRFRGGTWHMEG